MTLTGDRIAIAILAGVVAVESYMLGSLFGTIKGYEAQVQMLLAQNSKLQTQYDKLQDIANDFNRKLAAIEIKYEICIDLVKKQQKSQ